MSDNNQDVTIGDQQERLYFYIGYLLGMIDGEGSCQFGYKYLYKGCKVFSPKITIFNNNPSIIDKTKNVLDKLGVTYYFFSTQKGNEFWPVFRIEIAGIKRVKFLTDILLKYPSGKRDKLKLLNDFCNHRLLQGRKKYSEVDKAYFKELKRLNSLFRGKSTESSETTRSDAKA